MIKILEKQVNDNVIKELLKVDYIDDFRNSIYKVEEKGKELYSFPFFDCKNRISKHILFHNKYRKVVSYNEENSFWIKRSKVFSPEYLFISDRPEEIIKYISLKNHIFSKTSYICFTTNNFDEKTFTFLKENFRFEKVITRFYNSSMKDILKLKTTFLLNDSNITIFKEKEGYKTIYKDKEIFTNTIDYPYLRNRFKLKFKFPIIHK